MIIDSILRFAKIKQIGSGKGLNSIVWLARDHQLNCELAIKEIDKKTFWNPNCFAEAQAVKSVSHPNVVEVQYGCEDGSSAFIGMPFYPDGTLADALSNGPIQLSKALTITHGILLGLEHIHVIGFIHLDIKPSNIFFDDQDRPLIADFGQCRSIGPGGAVIAPPVYKRTMPPEILLSGNASFVSDIFHMGALLYRMVNGEDHWQGQLSLFKSDAALEDAIIKGKFPDRNGFLPHVPKRLRTVIRKALSLKPSDRFTAASDFGKHLGRVNLERDWNVLTPSSGEMTWHCAGHGCADTVVELLYPKGSWTTQVFTVSDNGIRRAKSKDKLWGKFNSKDQALKDLKRVFETL